jgi:hypothetical protein
MLNTIGGADATERGRPLFIIKLFYPLPLTPSPFQGKGEQLKFFRVLRRLRRKTLKNILFSPSPPLGGGEGDGG